MSESLSTTISRAKKGKKVILFIVDSLMSAPLRSFVQSGKGATLKYLMDQGFVYDHFVSSFPTMSVNINSTLFTGTYAEHHHVPGLVWFSKEDRRIIDLGSSKNAFFTMGPRNFIKKTIRDLNLYYLNNETPTIHQTLTKMGYTTGSINELIFRGNFSQEIRFPRWASWLGITPQKLTLKVPHLYTYGMLKRIPGMKHSLRHWKNFGFTNLYAIDVLTYLMKKKELPDFTVVYLPDLDQEIHKNGPSSMNKLDELDQNLEKVLQTSTTWEKTLSEYVFLLLGDSGQDQIVDIIDLDQVLYPFPIYSAKKYYDGSKAIAVGHNEKMAFLYTLHPDIPLNHLIEVAKKERRIDIIAWKEGESVYVQQGGKNETLHFKKQGAFIDPYNQNWTISGDASILDLRIDPQTKRVEYGDYPDALARLYSSLFSHQGEYIVITAKLGCEFKQGTYPTHMNGGSHGSLHRVDSTIPFIICGTDQRPHSDRIVDLNTYLISLVEDSLKKP